MNSFSYIRGNSSTCEQECQCVVGDGLIAQSFNVQELVKDPVLLSCALRVAKVFASASQNRSNLTTTQV